MDALPVQTTLSVDVTGNRLFARAVFSNIAESPIYILKDNPSLFVTHNDKELQYIGIVEKRRPYTIDDYEKLMPGKQTTRNWEFTKDFQFLSGKQTYVAIIGGGYFDPLTKKHLQGPEITASFEYAQ